MNQPSYAFYDLKPGTTDMLAEVLEGLSRNHKTLPPKYFYDERGSELFEAITRLPEYYLTGAELSLFTDHLAEIADSVGPGCALVEYGSGNSKKVRLLLDALQPQAYVPVDISRDHLAQAAESVHRDYPWLGVYPTCADFSQPFALPPETDTLRKVALFPGSSIGNFEPVAAEHFLRNVASVVGAGGELLIGVDRKKDRAVLEAAYNDSAGVTAEFNRNVLTHINEELGANFDASRFDHAAEYDDHTGCVKMFLVSRVDQSVSVGGRIIRFAAGERIHTENSYKYHPDEFLAIATRAGFACQHFWTDVHDRFALFLLGAASVVA